MTKKAFTNPFVLPFDCYIFSIVQASLNQKRGELENRRQDIVQGLLLRSRANWHENGERCSEYFCKLEKKSSIHHLIWHHAGRKIHYLHINDWMNTISCNIVPVQIEFLIVLKYDYLFHW
jgi:hypothetical protein